MAPVLSEPVPVASNMSVTSPAVPAWKGVAEDRSLPAQWFRDERIFHIERRAIFSKLWILATHVSRFDKAGDYLKLEIAGYPYFVVRTRDGTFKAFHNVCRHRAFPLIHKTTGSSTVIGCKYHGWSYSSSTGALIKAPQFQGQPNFRPEENGLFKIHTHVTQSGFIFVNLYAGDLDDGDGDVPSFEQHFGDLPREWDTFRPEEYEYAYSWTVTGSYNWKTFMDGYQECYHCQIAHPGFAKSLDLPTYSVAIKQNYARHTAENLSGPKALKPKGAPEGESPPSFTFIFPSNGVTVTDVMWYMMRAIPLSATETRMEYDVFKRKDVSMEDLRQYMEFYEQVEQEDYLLCVETQKNLNVGIYSRGFLHPKKEESVPFGFRNGVLFYQTRAREFVEAHLAREKELGKEWNPAQPVSQGGGTGSTCKGDSVCSSLGPEMTW